MMWIVFEFARFIALYEYGNMEISKRYKPEKVEVCRVHPFSRFIHPFVYSSFNIYFSSKQIHSHTIILVSPTSLFLTLFQFLSFSLYYYFLAWCARVYVIRSLQFMIFFFKISISSNVCWYNIFKLIVLFTV